MPEVANIIADLWLLNYSTESMVLWQLISQLFYNLIFTCIAIQFPNKTFLNHFKRNLLKIAFMCHVCFENLGMNQKWYKAFRQRQNFCVQFWHSKLNFCIPVCLPHWDLVTVRCICEPAHQWWFKEWLVTEYYLNQCYIIVNWTYENNL